MKGCIKITDRVGVGDFMALFGERARRSSWLGHDVWTAQEGDDAYFEDLCNSGVRIHGADFIAALGKVIQVIDGQFEGFDIGSDRPWVVLESIDSSFHLLHADEDVLANARARFTGVSSYEAPAVPWRRKRSANEQSA